MFRGHSIETAVGPLGEIPTGFLEGWMTILLVFRFVTPSLTNSLWNIIFNILSTKREIETVGCSLGERGAPPLHAKVYYHYP